MYSLQLKNYIYYLVNYYIKYRRKSINPNVVFEDSHRFSYQEMISKKQKNRDPTRPDPRVHPTRGQLCSANTFSGEFLLSMQVSQ